MLFALIALLLTSWISPSFSSIIKKDIPQLTSSQRESIRFHLTHLFNQMDLLIRNEKIDQADLKKQEKDLEQYKVYERIPFQADWAGLKKNLSLTAQDNKVTLLHLKIIPREQETQLLSSSIVQSTNLPSHLYTDSNFHLSEDQIVERLYFELTVKGSLEDIRSWTNSWQSQQLRLTELTSHSALNPIESIGKNQWKIRAHTFRFRNIHFPRLIPKNPRSYLPQWAQKDFKTFSEMEPALSETVSKIEILTPKARPHLKTREKFLLNDARLSFFLESALGNKTP